MHREQIEVRALSPRARFHTSRGTRRCQTLKSISPALNQKGRYVKQFNRSQIPAKYSEYHDSENIQEYGTKRHTYRRDAIA